MVQEIYIIDDDDSSIVIFRELFKNDKEFKFISVKSEQIDIALKNIPALIVINEDAINIDVVQLCRRIRKDEEARTRTEQELAKYKNETLETTDISQEIDKKSISINDIKRNILTSKITESEKEQKEADIAKNQRKRLLFKRSREGVELSQEERLMLEEMERQRMQSEYTYKDKRENRKGQGQLH